MKRIIPLLLIALFVLSVPLTVSAASDREIAEEVQAKIDSISEMGLITLEEEEAIKEIRAAYDALTGVQQHLVDATLLWNAETQIEMLRGVKIDQLSDLISQIGDPVTLADEPTITEAMDIYDWLTYDERTLVDYEKLTLAEGQLKKLQKAAAAEADALIDAIGYVTKDSGNAIAAARAAYDALTPGSQKYVAKLSTLTQAEQIYASLVPQISIFPETESDTGTTLIIIIVLTSALIVAPVIVIALVVTSKRRNHP